MDTDLQSLPSSSGQCQGLEEEQQANHPSIIEPHPRAGMRPWMSQLKRKLTKKDKRRIRIEKEKRENAMVIKSINKHGKARV